MADPANVAAWQQTRQQGLLLRLITLPFRFLGVLCGSLLLFILIECAGMYLFWENQSWHHARDMLHRELDNLDHRFTRSIVVQEPGRTITRWVNTAQDFLFVRTGLLQTAKQSAQSSHDTKNHSARDFRYYLTQPYIHMQRCLIAAAYATLVFGVRLCVLSLMIPLLLMAMFVGLVDGLVRRDLRRFESGRESGFVYHRAKATLIPLLVLPWVIYLTLPVSVNPLFVLPPSAVLLGVAVDVVAGSFKKYL